ncbi:MAG: hypothetical protein HZA52_11785 [Planctomycetes bacterium]|nr:hypothetical protein [Planctomycetota bacterium]
MAWTPSGHFERASKHDTVLGSPSNGLEGARLVRATWNPLESAAAEDAVSCGAELRVVVFQRDSTRGVLVFDRPPMDGSRTGFHESGVLALAYERPEELRVANFRGADLRGGNRTDANIDPIGWHGAVLDAPYSTRGTRCAALARPATLRRDPRRALTARG